MAALFGHGNPLSTPVGQLIEQATDGCQASENWALYMEVCDIINETEEGPKDAIRAFRKKLSQNVGKNYTSVIYALTCIEACVKNCGRRFHVHVANKDFLHDLIKIIGPKNDPPLIVQEKVLSMIQTWADAFRGIPELKEVEKVFLELKQKGIEFPVADLDNLAPIHTPARSVPERQPVPGHDVSGGIRGPAAPATGYPPAGYPPAGGHPPVGYPPAGGVAPCGGALNPDQTMKLRRELEVVQGNVHVMSEMLTELSPGNVDASNLDLLQELNRTCRQMQSRIVELLNRNAPEEITSDLLRVNDDLNNVFLRYERFERYRTGQTGQSGQTSAPQEPLPPSYNQLPAASTPAVGNLIDLSDDPVTPAQSVTTQMAGLTVGNSTAPSNTAAKKPPSFSDEFEALAQSRQIGDQIKPHVTGANFTSQQMNAHSNGQAETISDEKTLELQDKETDYDEMEQWLKTHGAAGVNQPESVTRLEFDKFLSERANASDDLPTISAQTGQQPARNSRTLQKTDQDENPLFAL
ncbi:hypothetical protein BsWGS_20778 [Bradybaena similaris]